MTKLISSNDRCIISSFFKKFEKLIKVSEPLWKYTFLVYEAFFLNNLNLKFTNIDILSRYIYKIFACIFHNLGRNLNVVSNMIWKRYTFRMDELIWEILLHCRIWQSETKARRLFYLPILHLYVLYVHTMPSLGLSCLVSLHKDQSRNCDVYDAPITVYIAMMTFSSNLLRCSHLLKLVANSKFL